LAEEGLALGISTDLSQVTITVDGERSSGLYAGASGEARLQTPNFEVEGHLTVTTRHGMLSMHVRERFEEDRFLATGWVDGDRSTGVYRNARGEICLARVVHAFGATTGLYWGTLQLENSLPDE
jgi:hypothetical protein